MSSENEAVVRRVFHEGTSAPNPRPVLDELFAPDFACHGPPGMEHDHAGGAGGLEKCIFAGAFTDLAFSVSSIRSDGDRVVATFAARGKQVAEFQGVPPHDEEVTVTGFTTFRVDAGRIAEGWGTLNWGPHPFP